MYRHWLDKLFARLRPPRPSTSARRRPPARPHVESLESRCLLSMTIYYDGRVAHVDIDMQPPFGVPIYLRHFISKTAIIGVAYAEFADTTFDSLVVNTTDNLGPITVIGVAKPTTINILAGHIPVHVGANGEPLDLGAPVSINGQGGTADVSYEDNAQGLANPVYDLLAAGSFGLVRRSGLGGVSYSGISSLSLFTADAPGERINIFGTAVATPTTVYDDTQRATINVGDPSQALVLNSPLTVRGNAYASLSYNDQANPTPGLTYTMSANRVQRNGLANLDFSIGGFSTVTVNTGSGGDTVNVLSTDGLGSTFQVNCGTGNDAINIGTSTTAPSLADPLSVSVSPSGTGHLFYNDQANPSAALTYTLGTGLVQHNGLADVSYSGIQDLSLHTGTVGDQTVNVLSTAATPAGTIIFGGQGIDTINVGDPAAVLDLRYPLYVQESGGGTKTLRYNDQANPTAALAYTLSSLAATPAGTVRRNGFSDLTYYGINNLVVSPGPGGDTVNVLGTGSLNTYIDGSRGNDTINVGDPGRLLALGGPLIVNERGGGTKTLNYNDQANPTPIGLTYTLSVSGTNGLVQRNGLADVTYTGLTNLVVNSAATGNQTIDVLSTAATSAAAVTVNGGRGLNAFFLGNGGRLAGLTAPVTVTNAGQLFVDNSADTVNHPTVVIAGNGITGLAPAPLNFSAASVGQLTVLGGHGNNTYTVTGTPAASSTNLTTGDGVDTVAVQAASTPLSVLTNTGTGGGGNDVVTLGNAGRLAGITAAVGIANGVSKDRLVVDDSADDADHPDVTIGPGGITGLAPAALNFNSSWVSSLTVLGGQGQNSYAITGTPAATGVDLNPGAGVDTITVQANLVPVTIDSQAGSGADTITLGDPPNGLSRIGAAVVVLAAATDSLTLNDQDFAGARTFTITDTTVSWGGPTVTYSGLGALTVQGGSDGTTFVVLATSATAALTLDGNGATDTLAGSDAGNVFAVTGGDSGTLNGNAYATAVTFNQVGNLVAGQGGDVFQFADQATLSGSIAGSGLDTLDYTAYTTSVIVDLQTGLATGVGGSVSGILNVNGGSGGDPGTYNLLIGAGGNTLTGGTGRRNIRVAGGSAGTLNGGDQDDLLIAGSTVYDTEADLASWLAIAAYWAGTDDYFTRVANLTSGSGVPLLDASTVLGNGGGNVLNGNGELALIFSDGFDFLSGFDPNSQTVAINP